MGIVVLFAVDRDQASFEFEAGGIAQTRQDGADAASSSISRSAVFSTLP